MERRAGGSGGAEYSAFEALRSQSLDLTRLSALDRTSHALHHHLGSKVAWPADLYMSASIFRQVLHGNAARHAVPEGHTQGQTLRTVRGLSSNVITLLTSECWFNHAQGQTLLGHALAGVLANTLALSLPCLAFAARAARNAAPRGAHAQLRSARPPGVA